MRSWHRAKVRPRELAAVGVLAALSASGSALAAPVKVACVGAHTTGGDRADYPAKLQAELGANFDVRNFGESIPESVAYLPDIVVIGSWGRHDPAAALDPVKFQADYEQLVTAYLDLSSKPTVYVSTPVPVAEGARDGATTSVVLPAVEKVAAKYNLPIVPLYSVFLDRPDLYEDGTHVSDDARVQAIADTVYEALGFNPGYDAGGAASGRSGASSGPSSRPGSSPQLGDMSTNASAGCAVAASPGEAKGTTVWALIANVGLFLARATRSRRYA